MKEQEVYVKVPDGEENNDCHYGWFKELPNKVVFTPEEFEKLAGKIWEAAALYQQQAIYTNSYGGEIEAPPKETYLQNLNSNHE